MSVLIKRMDMPKNCDGCDLSTWEGFPLGDLKLVCQLLGQVDNIKNRDEDCPLVEIPTPHGRLIDADALLEHKTDHTMISTHLIYNAPTVIETEL